MKTMTRLDYETWMKLVDDFVWARVGCSVHDLADCCFWDWWNDGVTARGAAARAIKNQREI